MGFFQPGDLPPCSSCRQIYHVGVKGGKPAEERELSVWEGRFSGLPAGKFAFTCFLFFLLKNKGICRLLTEGTKSIKQCAESCRHMFQE